MHITKAMELVATSKLRRAKEKVERARPYYEALRSAVISLFAASPADGSPFSAKRASDKTLYIVIAGDRGLAGGYNSNIFKLAKSLSKNTDDVFLPIGKKALEHYRHTGASIFSDALGTIGDASVGSLFSIAAAISEDYKNGKFGRIVLVYTKFVSMLTQLPVYEELLPITCDADEAKNFAPIIEDEAEEMLERVVPEYIGGILWSAVCEASASESGARRSSMNAANKNAEEMIDTLMLKYNRARQAIITQEITEIVSGAEAL